MWRIGCAVTGHGGWLQTYHMIRNFMSAHRFLAYLAGAGFFGLLGFIESRVFPRDSSIAIPSWFFAILLLSFDLATTRSLLPEGPILGLAVFVGGIVWMVRYYNRHRPK